MQRVPWLFPICLALSLSASAVVNVTVTSPNNFSQLTSPFTLAARATSPYSITGWAVYLDGATVYTAGRTLSISTLINSSSGAHVLVTRAWDSSGAYGNVSQQINVSGGGGGNGLPTPPTWATVFNSIQNRGNWSQCHDPGCAGGSGNGSYWMAQYQGQPSRSGSSTEFFNSGVWANALWWQKVGSNDSARNFLWDFYIYLDDNSQRASQTLEFDAFQFVNGYNYMIGTQCNYAAGVWDLWDEASGHWSHSSIACPKFSSNAWHHIQWYMTTDTNSHTYKYVTLVVDGNSKPVNVTGRAKNLGWSSNVGVQWQLDVNATGQGYHEWLDNAVLTIW